MSRPQANYYYVRRIKEDARRGRDPVLTFKIKSSKGPTPSMHHCVEDDGLHSSLHSSCIKRTQKALRFSCFTWRKVSSRYTH